MSSGRRARNSHIGTKPTINVIAPRAIQPARQPCWEMAEWAIRGIATSASIWANVTIEEAMVRRVTNRLLSAP